MKAWLRGSVIEAKGITSYYFEPEKELKYLPGQFVYLSLPLLHYPDLRANIRHFSLSSSPTEGNILKITSLDGISGYKKTLQELNLNIEVDIDGPHGVYKWPYKPDFNHCFIAGGIGITPMRSRIKYNFDSKSATKISLIYSTSSQESASFYEEFKLIANKSHLFEFHTNFSQEEGRLTPEKLGKNMIKESNAVYWICGSTSFVDDLEEMLIELNISPQDILTEKFTGY